MTSILKVEVKDIKRAVNLISWCFAVVFLLLAMALVGVKVFGLTPYAVLSGSMEPTYKTGSIIYVKKIDPAKVQEGDPITFNLGGGVVATHRVFEKNTELEEFYTKGDANDFADASPVSYKNVIGKPVFSLPYLGYLSNFVLSKQGKIVLVCVMALILITIFMSDGKKDKKEKPVV